MFTKHLATINNVRDILGETSWETFVSYPFTVTHRKLSLYSTPYDIVNHGTDRIVNGTARPYKGDRCVYTSAEDVRINIKDNTATKLYYAESTYANDTFTVTGATQEVDIGGAAYVNIDKTTLTDGSIYSVWTDADSTKEHFEYHDVSTPIDYSITDGVLTLPDDLDYWYAVTWGYDMRTNYGVVCMHKPDENNSAFAEYRDKYMVQSLQSVIFKGTLGAYVSKNFVTEEAPETGD
jgi:hypothetical protein